MSGRKLSELKVAARSFIEGSDMLWKTKCDFAKPCGACAKVPAQHCRPSPVMMDPHIVGKLIDS